MKLKKSMWLPITSQNKNLVLFLIGAASVLLGALLQSTELLTFYETKLNLVLVLVLTFGFFLNNFWHYLILSLVGVLILKIAPGLDIQTLVLLILLLAAFYLKKYLFTQPIINNAFLIAAGTLLFYIFADFNFLIYNTPTVLLEIIYNTIGGLIVFSLLEKSYG